MKLILNLLILAILFAQSAFATERFKNEKATVINWATNPDEWFDLAQWKRELEFKKLIPDWERNLRETSRTELVGRVLESYGDAKVYRGLGNAQVQYLSAVYEGDEIATGNNGYLWLYLMDGTLARLSPQSSISVQEINVSENEIFYFVRLNVGNLLWMSRKPGEYKADPLKETDVLYFPLKLYEANYLEEQKLVFDEEDLYSSIEDKSVSLIQYDRLNKLMADKKDQKLKTVVTFLVLPNGTILGKDMVFEATVLTGNNSYFKLRTAEQLRQSGVEYNRDVKFFYRGLENKEEFNLESGKWYQIGSKGRDIQEFPTEQIFAMSEFVTSNIPSILIARELMMERFGDFLHSEKDQNTLGFDYGYRLWTGFEDEKGELSRRVAFLKEFTRRIETTNLLSAEKLSKRLVERGEAADNLEFGSRFYEAAMSRYHIYKESLRLINSDRQPLNSELNPYWKRINVYK